MADTVTKSRMSAQPAPGPSDAFDAAQRFDSGALGHWLNSGGDSRLRLKSINNLSDYGCRPFPRPHALSFASSTASTISERAYAAVENAVSRLRSENQFGDLQAFVETMRSELKAVWNLGEETDVVFAPSGTDAELRALFLAKCTMKPPVVSILVGSDETGSGVPFAAAGCHFNAETANGFQVVKGEPIHGLALDVGLRPIPTRGADGRARPPHEVDAAVFEAAKAAIASGNTVILHVMAHSKLGTFAPTPECVSRMTQSWGGSVQIIVDACQARVSRAQIKSHLAQNRIVLISGSKFFTGPAFSGAVLVPAALSARAAESMDVPLGFLKYTRASDWPARFERLRSLVPPTVNLGQALRWAAALEEMRTYFSVPGQFRSFALAEFAKFVTQRIGEQPSLQLLEQPNLHIDADEEFSVPSVFSFLPMRNGRLCSMAEATLLYHALNEDVSTRMRASTRSQRRLLAQCCHIGQPVAIPQSSGESGGSLRVSADARLISQSWFGGDEADAAARFRANIEKIRIVFTKLQFLLDYLAELRIP
jgi:hypothetical protein